MILKKRRGLLLTIIACAALAACGGAPKEAKTEEPPEVAEPVTGREAYQKTYLKARLWANDAELLKLQSVDLEGIPTKNGEAGAWQAQYASLSKNRTKVITYAAAEGPGNLHKGVFEGSESSFSGGQLQLIQPPAIKIDSDKAHEVAVEKSKEYMAKNPDMGIFYVLEVPVGSTNAQWRVVWGRTLTTSNYSILVDAATGEYLKTMR